MSAIQRFFIASLVVPVWLAATGPVFAEPAGNPAAAEAAADAAPPPASTEVSNDYLIQPGDLLDIMVWREQNLTKDVLVRPDGGINFPLVGEIQASGKSIKQLQDELVARLSKYYPDPVVTIAIKHTHGYKIYIVGKVQRPGEFSANRAVDVMQALSMAGGPTPFASVNKIKILRRENGELKSIPFKYSRVEKGEDLEQNIVLHGGDIVVVP